MAAFIGFKESHEPPPSVDAHGIVPSHRHGLSWVCWRFRVKKRVKKGEHDKHCRADMLPTCLQSMLRRVPSLLNQHVGADMSACTHLGVSTNEVRTLPRQKN